MGDMGYKGGLVVLLSFLRGLVQYYQHAHWKTSGLDFYQRHLLFERLYNTVLPELDKVAEKILGVFGDDDSLAPLQDADFTHKFIDQWATEGKSQDDVADTLIDAEEQCLAIIKDLLDSDEPSHGVQNLLQGIYDTHEGNLYLLKQMKAKEPKMPEQSANDESQSETSGLDAVFDEIMGKVREIKSASEVEVKTALYTELMTLINEYMDLADYMAEIYSTDRLEDDKVTELSHLYELANKYVQDKGVLASSSVIGLVKLANAFDEVGLYSTADELDKAVAIMAQRAGISTKGLAELADVLDAEGKVEAADLVDGLIKEAAKKEKQKPPVRYDIKKIPKPWFKEMKEKLKKKNPGYSPKRISAIVADQWFNEFNDAQRNRIWKRTGRKGTAQK